MKTEYKLNLNWEDEMASCSLVEQLDDREIVLAGKEIQLIEGVTEEEDTLDFTRTLYGQIDTDITFKLTSDDIFLNDFLLDDAVDEYHDAWEELRQKVPGYIEQLQKGEDVILTWQYGEYKASVPYTSKDMERFLALYIFDVCNMVQAVMEEAEIIPAEITEVNLSGQWAESIFVKKRLGRILSISIELANTDDVVEVRGNRMEKIYIYTDGACSGNGQENGGKGGFGAIIRRPGMKDEILKEGYRYTTNNRMELMAVIKSLEKITEPSKIVIVSDSTYVVDSVTKKWLDNWQKKGWKTASGKLAKNIDLWKRYLEVSAPHEIEYEWVKGHETHEENNACDIMAVEARMGENLLVDEGYEKNEGK